MGKFKKNKREKVNRHNPLDQEILENRYAQPSTRNKIKREQLKDEEVSASGCFRHYNARGFSAPCCDF